MSAISSHQDHVISSKSHIQQLPGLDGVKGLKIAKKERKSGGCTRRWSVSVIDQCRETAVKQTKKKRVQFLIQFIFLLLTSSHLWNCVPPQVPTPTLSHHNSIYICLKSLFSIRCHSFYFYHRVIVFIFIVSFNLHVVRVHDVLGCQERCPAKK